MCIDKSVLSAGDSIINVFKTLPVIQGRQVGFIVGALLADSACRAIHGANSETIKKYSKEYTTQAVMGVEKFSTKIPFRELKKVKCAKNVKIGQTHLFSDYWLSNIPQDIVEYRTNSPSGCRTLEILKMMSHHAPGSIDKHISALPLQPIKTNYEYCYNRDHIPLFPTTTILPLAVTYPYCTDQAIQNYALPLLHELFQTHTAWIPPDLTKALFSPKQMGDACNCALSFLPIFMRYLQNNPDPIKNAAFHCVPTTTAMFPRDKLAYCVTNKSNEPAISVESGQRGVFHQLIVNLLTVIDNSSTFEEGVAEITHRGGPYCSEMAMIAGACLGAKVTARNLPSEWLTATENHSLIASLAIKIVQESWNFN